MRDQNPTTCDHRWQTGYVNNGIQYRLCAHCKHVSNQFLSAVYRQKMARAKVQRRLRSMNRYQRL